MPRKPTGRPRGRPPGSGQLDNPTRLTVWMHGETYARLEAYADGRHYHRGEPQLSACVRELLEHALACPYKNQTQNIPVMHGDNNRPIENVLAVAQNISERIETITAAPENNYYEQIQTIPLVIENISEQIETVPLPAENIYRQTEIVPDQSDTVPAYDTSRYSLGDLCGQSHDYHDTGQSLRDKKGECLECKRKSTKERTQRWRAKNKTKAATP
jgi:hypothetical protein